MHDLSLDLQLFHNCYEVCWLCSIAPCPNFGNSSQVLLSVGGGLLQNHLLYSELSVFACRM
jgi:hypothetical protein